MVNGMKRRNFMKYAGTAAAAAGLAGCTGGNDGNGGGGGGSTNQQDTLDSGDRPVKWIGPAWAVRDGQKDKFTEKTGIEMETTNATIPTTQQKVLSGGRESLDAVSLDSSGAGAIVNENDASLPIPTENLSNWDPDKVSDLFTNPEERIGFLGEQVKTHNELLWWDTEKQDQLRFAPHAYNFDALGYNPKYVDSVSKWSALFDDQYKGKVAMGSTASITVPEALMHLVDNDMVDGEVGQLNNPTEDQIDAAVDFLMKEKQAGQFRSTWEAYGTSVNLMAGEEAVLGDLWQPAALDVRRSGTPCSYATMSKGVQGYRYWFGGISPLNPGAKNRNNTAEVEALINDVHYGAWFPGFTQGWGYSVPHYPNKELVRDSDEGMGPEYYDWAYEGKATYKAVENPALFDPQKYDWSMEEGNPNSNGVTRDSGPIEDRIDRIGFFQIWPDNATHMLDRWKDFKSA